LIAGTDKGFEPQAALTRAMLVTILARGAGIETAGGSSWYARAAEWGMANGLTDGTDMLGAATREQFAALLYRYWQLRNPDTGSFAPPADLSAFADAESVSEWAREAVEWAVGNGLMQGRAASAIGAKTTATRAEAAALLQRYFEKFEKSAYA
ncbi:MAG: S-layer homology domain-containing protein, partial [Clostridiales bacterium]|nr:S-layer homology domain-containing protein [Clostridiales bacterium]